MREQYHAVLCKQSHTYGGPTVAWTIGLDDCMPLYFATLAIRHVIYGPMAHSELLEHNYRSLNEYKNSLHAISLHVALWSWHTSLAFIVSFTTHIASVWPRRLAWPLPVRPTHMVDVIVRFFFVELFILTSLHLADVGIVKLCVQWEGVLNLISEQWRVRLSLRPCHDRGCQIRPPTDVITQQIHHRRKSAAHPVGPVVVVVS